MQIMWDMFYNICEQSQSEGSSLSFWLPEAQQKRGCQSKMC